MSNDIAAAVERLKGLCELRKMATPGAWKAGRAADLMLPTQQVNIGIDREAWGDPDMGERWARWEGLCDFIAAAGAVVEIDLPALLAAYEEQQAEIERLRIQLDRVRATLRLECADLGDNDWPDELELCDVIEKHLARPAYRGVERLRGLVGELAENARRNLADFRVVNESGMWRGHPFTHAVAEIEALLNRPDAREEIQPPDPTPQ